MGTGYDNALAETVIGLFKTEVIHRRGPWRSYEAVKFATLDWVDCFNRRRLLEPVRNIPRQKLKTATTPSLKPAEWPPETHNHSPPPNPERFIVGAH